MGGVAVYTTVYPGVEPYLPDWYRSLQAQTDNDFQLWIGVDALDPRDVVDALGGRLDATWVRAAPGDTHAQVRQRALARIVEQCDAVVFVDSDDIMHPSRVADARTALRTVDVVGCALRLVDERRTDLGVTLTVPPDEVPEDVLPRTNVFGLSNTAYSSTVLRQFLPLPAEAVLVDWYLITRAWLRGIPLSFEPQVGMDYRQHGANTARVLPPFTGEQVRQDTLRARRHFEVMAGVTSELDLPDRRVQLARAAEEVIRFQQRVVDHPDVLRRYLDVLNGMSLPATWWSSVAHPALRDLWRSG